MISGDNGKDLTDELVAARARAREIGDEFDTAVQVVLYLSVQSGRGEQVNELIEALALLERWLDEANDPEGSR